MSEANPKPESESVFRVELVASCGMNCALCSGYQAYIHASETSQYKSPRCKGCRPRGKMCAWIKRDCDQLRTRNINFCYECETFPCDHLTKLDARYRTRYSYSMVDTLCSIKANGIEATLAGQREKHRCSRCGGVTCIHNGKCYHCDEVKSWRG
jgi:Protein of unknown function (DUF3795)